MKVLALSDPRRYARFAPKEDPAYQAAELIFCDREAPEEEWLAAGGDAEALFVLPVTWIRESLIARMPTLTASTWRRPGSGAFTCAIMPGAMPGQWRRWR